MRRLGLHVGELSDDGLLAGYRDGELEMTVAFVRRFQRRVYGVACVAVLDPVLADDVAQQAFEGAWLHAGLYNPHRGSVAAWLMTITRNLAIDATRVTRPQSLGPSGLLLDLNAGVDGAAREALPRDLADDLWSALARLPVEQARVLALAGICGLSNSEVAVAEGIPLGTAKTRIRIAFRRLRAEVLSDEEGAAMAEMSCGEFRDLAPELALGLLEGEERAAPATHAGSCNACRHELIMLGGIADELASLSPAVEPPPGFETRVIARVSGHPR